MIDYVTRIHLKPGKTTELADINRKAVLHYCLGNQDEQYIVIGWSSVYEKKRNIKSFQDYFDAVREDNKIMPPAVNVFVETRKDDLFWTRDYDGFYWICRAKGPAQAFCDSELDIGARIPVEAYRYGVDVPGQIKASFNRPRGGITHKITERIIVEFSKHVYNLMTGNSFYNVEKNYKSDILESLPDFELEELIISYIQIKEGYYVLSNSIANKSTTPLIECEFMSRDIAIPKKAVVQVKGKKGGIDVAEYQQYREAGYYIYFFAPVYENRIEDSHYIFIEKEDVLKFYNEYKAILPRSITRWEDIFV